MKKFLFAGIFALAMSTKANAMGNACLLLFNFPTHLVLWSTLDIIIYDWGTMETAAEQVTGPGVYLDDRIYLESDLDSNQGYAVSLQYVLGGPPQPPGAYRLEGEANIFFLQTSPTVQVIDHGADFCQSTVLVI